MLHKTAWTLLQDNSINVPKKRWDTEHLLKCSMNVLHRPVESAVETSHLFESLLKFVMNYQRRTTAVMLLLASPR